MRRLFKKELIEVIQKKDIDDLERKLKLFTKNIRRVSNGRDLYDAHIAFSSIREELERYLYHNVWGVISDKGKEAIRNTVFLATSQFLNGNYFSPKAGSGMYYIEQKYPEHMEKIKQAYEANRKIPYNAEYYEEVYQLWEKNRDYFYQKMSRHIREIIKTMNDRLQWGYDNQGIPEKAKVEYYKVKGVHIEIVQDETTDTIKHMQNVKEFLRDVGTSIDSIQKYKKPAQALKGLLLKYDPVDTFNTRFRNSLVAGYYVDREDYIALRGLYNVTTIVHEIGHRYYYKFMPVKYREMWEERLEGSYVEVTPEVEQKIRDAFWTTYTKEKYYDDNVHILLDMKKDVEKYFKDDFMKDFYRNAVKVTSGLTGTPFSDSWEAEHPTRKSQAEWMIDFFIDGLKQEKRINMSIVSDYGNTQPREAYADAFAYYILGGRWKGKIPDDMMSLFTYVTL